MAQEVSEYLSQNPRVSEQTEYQYSRFDSECKYDILIGDTQCFIGNTFCSED